jgi:hypothetical protein
MLSTDEYYRLAGGTPEGLVQAMFDDGEPTEIAGETRQIWFVRAGTLDRRAFAVSFLQAYPEVLQPTAEAAGELVAEHQRFVTAGAVSGQPRAPLKATPASNRRSKSPPR